MPDTGPRRAIFRPNAQQLGQLAVPPVVHNPLLSKLNEVTGVDSDEDSPIPYSETPSRWTLTACTVKSAMTTASCYSQRSWDMDSPVEGNIKTDPRRFAIALSPGRRLVLSGTLWTHNEHYGHVDGSNEDEEVDEWSEDDDGNWEMMNEGQWISNRNTPKTPRTGTPYKQKQVRWAEMLNDSLEEYKQVGDPLIDTPSGTTFVLQLQQTPLYDEPAGRQNDIQSNMTDDGTLIIPAIRTPCEEHKWPDEMEKELEAIDMMQQEKKKRKKIYSVAYKRASRSTKLFSRMLSRLSVQPHVSSTPSPSRASTSKVKSPVALKLNPPPVIRGSTSQLTPNRRRRSHIISMRPQSRRFSRYQLHLPDVVLSPLSVSFNSPSSPVYDQPPTPYPHGVPPYDPEADYDRFLAMERLRKLVTPLTASGFSSAVPSPKPSALHPPIPLPAELTAPAVPTVDKYHAMDKLRKLRFTAAGVPHKRSQSYDSDWDFHDSPLQMLRPSNPVSPVPPVPSVGQLVHRRSRSSSGARHRPSPLNLAPAGVSMSGPVALAV